jgi:hypothetical protein
MESPFSVGIGDASFSSHTAFVFEKLTIQMLCKIVGSEKWHHALFLNHFNP